MKYLLCFSAACKRRSLLREGYAAPAERRATGRPPQHSPAAEPSPTAAGVPALRLPLAAPSLWRGGQLTAHPAPLCESQREEESPPSLAEAVCLPRSNTASCMLFKPLPAQAKCCAVTPYQTFPRRDPVCTERRPKRSLCSFPPPWSVPVR